LIFRAGRIIVCGMFFDEPAKPKTAAFPRNLTEASVQELEDYTAQLHTELARVGADIEKKKASQAAAALFFKS